MSLFLILFLIGLLGVTLLKLNSVYKSRPSPALPLLGKTVSGFFGKIRYKLTDPKVIIPTICTICIGFTSRYLILVGSGTDVFKDVLSTLSLAHFAILAIIRTCIQIHLEDYQIPLVHCADNADRAVGASVQGNNGNMNNGGNGANNNNQGVPNNPDPNAYLPGVMCTRQQWLDIVNRLQNGALR